MVALTAGAVACAPEGDAGGFLQGGPPTGILLNPSSIVWLDTQKKNKCHDSKNKFNFSSHFIVFFFSNLLRKCKKNAYKALIRLKLSRYTHSNTHVRKR